MSKWASLSDCLSSVVDYRGKTPKKLGFEWSDNGIRAISANNVDFSGLVKEDTIKYASQELYALWMKEEVEKGDILLTSEAPAGRVMIWNTEEKIILSQRLYCLKVNSSTDSTYLKYYLQSNTGQTEINRNTTGSTVFGISASTFDYIRVIKPPITYQQKIASVLSSLDAKIELNNRIIAELEAMAKQLYDYWFVQFDFPNAEGKPYRSNGGKMVYNEKLKREIPEGWEDGNIPKIATIMGGGTPTTKNPSFWNGEINFFTPSDASNHYYSELKTNRNITEEGLKNCSSQLYSQDTIFLTARGTVGRINLAIENMAMNQSCYALNADKRFGVPYVHQSLLILVESLKTRASGAIFDAIVTADLLDTSIVLPPQSIGCEFSIKTTSLYKQIRNLIIQNNDLSSIRDWLLPMLMNGQAKVK